MIEFLIVGFSWDYSQQLLMELGAELIRQEYRADESGEELGCRYFEITIPEPWKYPGERGIFIAANNPTENEIGLKIAAIVCDKFRLLKSGDWPGNPTMTNH